MRASLQPVPLLVQGQIRAGCCSAVPCQRCCWWGGSLWAGAGGCGAAGTVLPAIPLPIPPRLHPGRHLHKSQLIPDRSMAIPNSFPAGPTVMPNSTPARGNPQLDPGCAHSKSQLDPGRDLSNSQHDPGRTRSNFQLDPGWSRGDTRNTPTHPGAFDSHRHPPWGWALFPSVEQRCRHGTGTGDTVRRDKVSTPAPDRFSLAGVRLDAALQAAAAEPGTPLSLASPFNPCLAALLC